MNNELIKNALILFIVTVIAGALLGFTYEMTAEPIKVQSKLMKTKAFTSVIEGGEFRELTDIALDEEGKVVGVHEGYIDEELAGYIFELVTKEGYGGEIRMVVGLNPEGQVIGIDVIKHGETPGLGAKIDEDDFKSQFPTILAPVLSVTKQTPTDPSQIQAISGATISSKAIVGAVNESLEFFNTRVKGDD